MKKFIICLLVVITASLTTVAQTVYKTPSGKKYHLATCRMVENVSKELTIAEAAQRGLEPCKICRPDAMAPAQPVVGKAKGQESTVQCKGFTKAGTRCRHKTSISDGYCYQHRP